MAPMTGTPKKRYRKGKPLFHPNSLEGMATPEQKKQIEEGRREMRTDARTMDTWAMAGFSAAVATEDTQYGSDDTNDRYPERRRPRGGAFGSDGV